MVVELFGTHRTIMLAPNNSETILAQALGGTLARPSVARASGDRPISVEIVMAGNHHVELDAVWAGEGRLGDVRRVLERLPDRLPRDLVIAARRFSPGALELLRERDANWADARGRAHIIDTGLIVLRDDAPGTDLQSRFAWSASALSVAEAILAKEWPDGIGTGNLARAADWSPAQVSQVLQSFDSQGWTKKFGPQRGPGSRRELVDADSMLDAWALELSDEQHPTRQAHRLQPDLEEFFRHELLPNLEQGVRWAAGGWIGASLLAPFATHLPALDIYVADGDFFGPLTDVMKQTNLQEVDEGGRIRFVSVPSQLIKLGRQVDSVPVASAPRIYVDLLRQGGRAEDVAEHLRDEVIAGLHRPFRVRKPSPELQRWEKSSRKKGLAKREESGQERLYERGTWTVSYRLHLASAPPTPTRLLSLLHQNVGHETGWPLWNARIGHPHSAEGVIESWLPEPSLHASGSADFWRATPDGRFFLLRGYQEDWEITNVEPGTTLDLTLPVWRTGEALLHASRMAAALDAPRVEFMGRWDGLSGRYLASVASQRRLMTPSGPMNERVIETGIEARTDAIEPNLPRMVRELVSPLFSAFGFFEPPPDFYESETASMRRPV